MAFVYQEITGLLTYLLICLDDILRHLVEARTCYT